jgi:hypothetical protein
MTSRNSTNRRPRQAQTPREPKPSTDLVVITRDGVDVPLEGTIVETVPGKREVVFTPYQAHKAVNALLALAGVRKAIPPQMMYRYRADGRFESTVSADGRWVVHQESFLAWALPYVEKSLAKQARALAA